MAKVSVAVLRSWYLPLSETFIYQELKHVKKTKIIVCATRKMNLKKFPVKRLFIYKKKKELPKLMKKYRVKLLHVRYGTSAVELFKLRRRTKLPMIVSFHGYDSPDNSKNNSIYRGRLNRLFRRAAQITVPSSQMKKILMNHGCSGKKIMVHRSGINISKFKYKHRRSPNADETFRILTVGRLVEKKGTIYLLKAFQRVLRKHPNCVLDIIGDGPLKGKLRRLAQELQIDHKVNFLGPKSHRQVRRRMYRADSFCLPSIKSKSGNTEGVPNVIKEAMATGLAVVATKHGGIPELVFHKENGYLVRETTVKRLSYMIRKLIRHPDIRHQMGVNGRKVVKRKFESKKQIRELENLYRKVIDANK